MALGAGRYPEPKDPSRELLRKYEEAESDRYTLKKLETRIEEGYVDLMDLYTMFEKWGFDTSPISKYENEELSVWQLLEEVSYVRRNLEGQIEEGKV